MGGQHRCFPVKFEKFLRTYLEERLRTAASTFTEMEQSMRSVLQKRCSATRVKTLEKFSDGSNSKLQSYLCSLYNATVWKIYPFRNVTIGSISKPATTQKNAEECYFTHCYIPISISKSIACSVVPKSLSTVNMLKFGKIIKPVEKKIFNVEVEEFDIDSKDWVVLGPVSFLTEISPFGDSGFRYTFKATSNHHKLRDAT